MESVIAASALQWDQPPVFENLFKSHFKALHAYAFTIVNDMATAEEMVQNVFCRIWEKRSNIDIRQSAKAYLYRAVYHESINHLKKLKTMADYQRHAARNAPQGAGASEQLAGKELEEKIREALEELPEQCRTIFQMSRFSELKYREIADALGISPKTVENQMGKALRIMRLKLAEFLPAFLYLIFHY
jgi:RNA polymerase sigma-70 factor (ECF subfamily)